MRPPTVRLAASKRTPSTVRSATCSAVGRSSARPSSGVTFCAASIDSYALTVIALAIGGAGVVRTGLAEKLPDEGCVRTTSSETAMRVDLNANDLR
jgi:hypothetical protein